jgi:hypothetical protein
MRKYLIAVMALAAVAVFASVGTAFGASPNTAGLDADFNADNPGATLTPGGLFVETTTLHDTDTTGTPTSPTKEPVPTTKVDLDFDHNLKINPNSVPTCGNALTGTTQAGMKACGDSYVGGGYATVCGATAGAGGTYGTACDLGVLNAQVAAYAGPKVSNQFTLKLQAVADHTPLGPLTVVLEGTLKKSPLGGEFQDGRRLTVPVPLLPAAAPGAAAITDFSVNIRNGNYLKGMCDGDNTWDYSARFAYVTGADTVTDSQPCT